MVSEQRLYACWRIYYSFPLPFFYPPVSPPNPSTTQLLSLPTRKRVKLKSFSGKREDSESTRPKIIGYGKFDMPGNKSTDWRGEEMRPPVAHLPRFACLLPWFSSGLNLSTSHRGAKINRPPVCLRPPSHLGQLGSPPVLTPPPKSQAWRIPPLALSQ